MKYVAMTQRKDKPIEVKPRSEAKTDAAFDIWLQRGLHKLFDDAANEPIPEEWLHLIEEDKKK